MRMMKFDEAYWESLRQAKKGSRFLACLEKRRSWSFRPYSLNRIDTIFVPISEVRSDIISQSD